jgi:hypothetical protein
MQSDTAVLNLELAKLNQEQVLKILGKRKPRRKKMAKAKVVKKGGKKMPAKKGGKGC